MKTKDVHVGIGESNAFPERRDVVEPPRSWGGNYTPTPQEREEFKRNLDALVERFRKERP